MRGAVAIIFGVTALFWPLLSPATMALTFGFFALTEAVLSFVAGFSSSAGKSNSIMSEGVVGLTVAIFAFIGPGIGALISLGIPSIMTLFLIVLWMLPVGIFQMVEGIQLRMEMRGEWSLVASSLLSFLCTFILISRWEGGAWAVSWIIGLYSILYGIIHVFKSSQICKTCVIGIEGRREIMEENIYT